MIAGPIETVITADGGITAQLSTYDFGSGAAPAVFTSGPVPEDADRPCIRIEEAGGPNWGSFESKGGIFSANVQVWGNKARSRKALRDLAQDLWTLLERVNLTIPGYFDVGTYADMPGAITDEDGFPGYLIPVRSRFVAT